MDELDVQKIAEYVMKVMNEKSDKIRVEASGRHVHLSEEDAIALFGSAQCMNKKDLSQPGQFVSDKKVTLVGAKGAITNVKVLGPCRKRTQVEISITDSKVLGVGVMVRESGDLDNTPNIIICVNDKTIIAKNSVIVAKRHIHMKAADAKKFDVKDKDVVMVKVSGDRQVIFDDVVIRVKENYRLSMHIDFDEANAVGMNKLSVARIFNNSSDKK